MANPFTIDRPASGGGNGPMKPGDVRTIQPKDPKTGEITKTFTLHRTDRPYVYDLCDAYNDARTRFDIIWIVAANGELKLVDDLDWQRSRTEEISKRHERERQECSRNNQLRPVGPD